MAPRTQAAAVAADERTEREFQLDVNTAVANTESEIFGDAMGDDELENDADTSLEQMGDGLEGDDLEVETDAGEEGDAAAEETETEEVEAAEGESEAAGDDQPAGREQRRGDERHEIRGVAPGVHRQERDRRRTAERRAETAEERADRLERELTETRGQVSLLSQQVTARPQPQQRQEEQRPDPEPDMFADPAGWKQWNDRRNDEKIAQAVQRATGGFRQELQQRDETRINQSFAQAESGERSFEFTAAYRALTSLNPRDPQARATVARIVNSPDPAAALFDWYEDNGAEDFRASVAEQLGLGEYYEADRQGQRPQARRGNGGDRQQERQPSRQQSGQPRSVVRLPPSLNSARGGGQRLNPSDPEAMDDSDAAVFRSATRAG